MGEGVSRHDGMVLGAFFNPTGHHVASWRHPDADADAGVNFDHQLAITRMAEEARFHAVFFADNLCVREADMAAVSRSAQYVANFEPLTLAAALAARTERIGLIVTASTTYNEPYHIARKFASLDHLSGGRAALNLVTSTMAAEARNFGRDNHLDHATRYERAGEFAEVLFKLWDSWDDDAFFRDKNSGRFFDPAKLHATNHRGRFFNVAGPLNIPRSPQGRPVIVQAGSSDAGKDFAAQISDLIFSNHLSLESAQGYYRDVKERAARHGRRPDDIRVLPGLGFVVGKTREEAFDKKRFLDDMIDPIVGREILSTVLGGVDLSPYDLDGPLPDLAPPPNVLRGAFENWTTLARRECLSIRQLGIRAASARGKSIICGTPDDIADHMQAWFEGGAADGFNVMPTHLPGGMEDFVGAVVPVLQRRGLFRRHYQGQTLRDNLGLPRPARRLESMNA